MRALTSICLVVLLASGTAFAQTMADVNRFMEKKEYENARQALEKLVVAGDIEAEFRLAGMYLDANGIPRNAQRAVALYESAAREKGHSGAQYALASELTTGGNIRKDPKRAMALMRTSARLKNPAAQASLCMELSTQGTPNYDAIEAYAWCEVAATKGYQRSGESGRRGKVTLDRIKQDLGADGEKAAKIRAADFLRSY